MGNMNTLIKELSKVIKGDLQSKVNAYCKLQLMDKPDEEQLRAFLKDFIKYWEKQIENPNYPFSK